MPQEERQFKTKNGLRLKGASLREHTEMLALLDKDFGIGSIQICESAAYSMAMVVRYALGLSAEGGLVSALVADCLSGWVTLATLRHLMNAGTNINVIYPEGVPVKSETFQRLEAPLLACSANIYHWVSEDQDEQMSELILSSHNIICGLYAERQSYPEYLDGMVTALNEVKTPVHCIQAPVGINVDSGAPSAVPLYASSTLSLGAPFLGLFDGSDFVGRHYVCDVSIPPPLYGRMGLDYRKAFSEQPVLQIFPDKIDEEEDEIESPA